MKDIKKQAQQRKIVCFGAAMTAAFLLLLTGCGDSVSVSFDSADGLTKKQIENEIGRQTDDYGDDAQDQADQIYDSVTKKGLNGYDALMQATDDILQGKTKGVNLSKLTKNGLYYFLVVKQYLYNHFIKVLVVLWSVVGLLVLFFRLRNKATAKAIITVLGFGVTIFLAIIVFSPV